MSPAGANIYIRAMNAYCAWLKEKGHVADQIILKQVKAPQKPVYAFSEAEIRALTAIKPRGDCERRTWALVQVLLDTGCRVGELLDLKDRDVDFDNCLLHVDGKGGKFRKVPFSLEGRKVLFRHLGSRKGYVFAARGGMRLMHRNVYRDLIALCRRAGITKRVHPHLTRHTFACHFMRNGGSIYTLSRILGHSSVSTTQVYVRGLGIEDFREEHQRLSPLARR
jgi:site-specific recombinase XerD